MVEKELYQIKQINELIINNVGFISINGFEDDVINLDYKYDGEDIYLL